MPLLKQFYVTKQANVIPSSAKVTVNHRVHPANTLEEVRSSFTADCIVQTGVTQPSFIRGGSAPRSKPLPFYIPFLVEKVPLSYTFHRK